MSSNTWRQYGGTRKQNQLHNLTIGTLVADQVLIRESYAGKFKIPGSIFVGADVNAIGNVYAFGSSVTTFDSYVGKNLYLNKNLYFGRDASLSEIELLQHAYMAGNFANKTIGINTQNPVSSFDINGSNDKQTQILSVSSLNAEVRSIPAKNVNNRGIALSATDDNAKMSFYIDTPLNYSNKQDALIQYEKGGNMTYSAANNNIISSTNTNISSTISTYLTAKTITKITTGQSVTIDTSNTNILSRLYISNRGQPTNIYNESTIIYDISNGLYLYDAYEKEQAKAGSALTLVATDNNSNTFLRLVTPNNAGLSIAAGTYPNDTSRTINTIGMTDNTGKYRVNQTVVSGNSAIKYYTTTGFNTYAPRTDNYIMDINGPTHISNGEINQMAKFDYEVLKISFSKTVKDFGIAVGTPSPTETVSPTINRLPQYISYTNDSGVTWTPVRVDGTGDFELGQQKNFTVYTHDKTYAFLGTSTSALYYTKDGGKNWVNAAANDPGSGNDYRRTYKTLFLSPTITDGKNRLFASVIREKDQRGGLPPIIELCVFYADLNLGNLPALPSQIQGAPDNTIYFFPNTNLNNSDNFGETVVNIAMTNIYASDGIDNSIYFVGTGINKFNISNVTSEYLKNTGNTYFGIHCINNLIVAVGSSIISYTKNGTDWLNSTLPSGLGDVTLRSVHLFDTNNGMAVGDNGTILYTKNGAVNWFIVPDSILNSSGYSARINGSNNQLRNIYMVDTNIISVTSVKKNYVFIPAVLTPPARPAVFIPGLSKVYTCYLPNLYNAATNNIFDVSGNMTVSGNIDINDGGNLNTNCPTFNLINTSAKTVNFAGDATSINIGNRSKQTNGNPSVINLNTDLDILGNTTLHSTVNMKTDLAVDGNLIVNGIGNSLFNGRLFVGKGLEVAEKAVFNNGIHVFGNIEHELDFRYLNRLYVEQDAYLYQRIFVGGDASLNGNVYIGGPLLIPATFTPNTNIITLTGLLPIQDSGSLEIGTGVSCYDERYGGWLIPQDTTIVSINQIQTSGYNPVTKRNDIPGDILNGNIITLSRPITANANVGTSITANVIFQNSKIFSVYPDTSLNSRLCVGGDVSLNKRLSVVNDISLGGNINIGDNTGVYANITTKGITYQATISKNGAVNTNQYNFLPYSQLQYIQTLSEDVQKRLTDLTTKTSSTGTISPNTQTVPTNLQLIETTNSSITISFSPVPNAYIYKAYVNGSFANGVNGKPYAVGSANSFTIFALNTSTEYTITVTAINAVTGSESSKSSELNTTTTTREFDVNNTESRDFTIDETTIDPSSFGVTTIDPAMLGLLDVDFSQNVITNSAFRNTLTTLLTFDVAGNNLFISGNLEPTTPSNLNIGASDYPFASLYLNNQNAINFMSQSLTNQGTMTFNLSTGYLDLSCNGRLGSTLLSYGGNVAIGKPLPTTNFDVLGQSIFNGDITQQTGNLYLTNRLFIQSDISLVGNMFSGKNLYQTGDTFLNSRVFVLGDISINSNLFILKDASLNQRLYVANDTSLNRNLFVGQNTTINGTTLLNNRLTVQGGTLINNDVSLNSNLFVNKKVTINNDLSLNGNLVVNGYAFLNSDEYLQGNLFVTGGQYLNGDMLITGFTTNSRDVTMNSRLYVFGDVSINNRLFLKGLANFNNDVLMNSNAFIKNDLSLNGNLSIGGTKLIVSGDTSLNGGLFVNDSFYVNRDSSFNGKVFVNNTSIFNSEVTLKNRLFLANDASFASNLYVNNKIITNNDLSINGSIFNSGQIMSRGDISTNSRLFVSGSTTLSNTLNVQGFTLLNSDLSVNANIFLNNSITSGNTFVKGNITLNGDASFNSNLVLAKKALISGDVSMNSDLFVNNNIFNNGSITTKSTLLTYSDATIGSNLYVNNNTNLNGELAVNGNANISGSVIVSKDVSLNGRLFVGTYPVGSIPINAIAGGAGLALGSFAGDVNIGKNFYVGAETVLYGNLTVVKNLTLLGQLIIKQYTVNQTITTVSYEVRIAEDLSLGGRLYMTGDASINGRLFVGQDVSLNANLYVGGKTAFAQPITIGNTLTINGQVIENGQVTTNALVTNNALNIFNGDISLNSRFYVGDYSNFNGDVSINNRLYVQNDTSFNGNFYAYGTSILNSDVSMNNRLYVKNDSSFNGNFFAYGLSILNSDVSINNRLYVQNDVSMSSNLYVNKRTTINGDVSINNRLYIQNDVSMSSNLFVAKQTILSGDVSLNTRLYVRNDVSMSSNLFVNKQTTLNGDVSMNTRLYVRNDVSFGSNLYVNQSSIFNGDVSTNNRLFVANDASINGNFYVGGKTIFQNEVSCNKVLYGVDASFTGNIAIYGNLYLHTDLRFDSLYVKKNISALGNVFITGQMTQMVDASLNGNLNVINDTSLNGKLSVDKDALFNSNMNVLKDTSLNQRLFVGSDTSLNGNLYVGINSAFNGNTIHTGDVSMVASLDLNGPMISRSNMNVYGIINQYNTNPTNQNTIVNNTSYVSSNASQVTLGTTSGQSVYVPGNIGIGIINPPVPLYINKSSTSTGQDAGYYISNSSSNNTTVNTTTGYNYSIYALNSIATSDKLIATSSVYFSDERIKTNIQDIDCLIALENLRQLKPKQYNYIDIIGQGQEPTLGFIAQEVKSIINHSVSISKNYIPNIYELCKIDNLLIRLSQKTTQDFFTGSKIRAITKSATEIIFTISGIIDQKTFTVYEYEDTDFSIDDSIFIYGQEIDDFNNLDKNAIFTITTAALKQVDSELQNTKKLVEQQRLQIETLESQIKIINAKLEVFNL